MKTGSNIKLLGVLGVTAVLALGISACASYEAEDARAAQLAVVTTDDLGDILVDGEGNVLYAFMPDRQVSVSCTFACASSWPPLVTRIGQLPAVDDGVDASIVGAMPATDGWDVVTYGGWPLYRSVLDKVPGQRLGQGVRSNGGEWYVMKPDGGPLSTGP